MNSKKYFLISILTAMIFLIVFSAASTIIDDTQSEFDNGTYVNMKRIEKGEFRNIHK